MYENIHTAFTLDVSGSDRNITPQNGAINGEISEIEMQLMLYYGVGKYISENSRSGFWGTGAIDAINEQLQKELPGLRGFSARNLRNMRMFFEEWTQQNVLISSEKDNLAVTTAKIENDTGSIWQLQLPNSVEPTCSSVNRTLP